MSEESRHPIDNVYDGVLKDLKELYPSAQIFDEYPAGKEDYVVPSVVFECVELLPSKDPKTGQLQMESMWDVTTFTPAKENGKSLKRVARIMAAEIGRKLMNRQYDRQAFPAAYEGSADANVDKHVKNIEVWTSTFSIVLRCGSADFDQMGAFPENAKWSSFVADKVFKP